MGFGGSRSWPPFPNGLESKDNLYKFVEGPVCFNDIMIYRCIWPVYMWLFSLGA